MAELAIFGFFQYDRMVDPRLKRFNDSFAQG
jgi:hypothetical protein